MGPQQVVAWTREFTVIALLWHLAARSRMLWMLVVQAEIIAAAIKDPHRFVLKPQREGGGNNFYNDGTAVHVLYFSLCMGRA